MNKASKVSKAYSDGFWSSCPDVYKDIVSKDSDRSYVVDNEQINRVFRAVLTFDHLRNEVPIGSKILDIGCGLGFNSCYLSKLGYDVKGFDASETGIERSKELAISLDLDPEMFTCMDHRYLKNIESESVDAIIGMGFIYYLDEKARDETYKEVSRILKNNGIFALTLTNMFFDAFSLNNTSLSFWSSVINDFSPAQNLFEESIEDVLNNHIKTPIREVAGGSISNRFGIHADNPILYEKFVERYGFSMDEILYPDSNILPPFLEKSANREKIDKIKAEYCVQNARNWNGMFMDYEFLAFLKKE
jgi:SAM-dependent methyltransferase